MIPVISHYDKRKTMETDCWGLWEGEMNRQSAENF